MRAITVPGARAATRRRKVAETQAYVDRQIWRLEEEAGERIGTNADQIAAIRAVIGEVPGQPAGDAL
jgi:hypothetical protein